MATVCRMWHLQGRQEEAVAELEKADALSRETGRRFAGARVLGAMALLTTDPERRRAALAEGEALLADGSVGHNYYWFYRDAIEASLGAGEWDEATRYADALEAFARPEPVAFSSFFARRGRALAEVGRGSGDIRLAGTLAELVSEAEAAGLKEPAAALSDALAAVGAG